MCEVETAHERIVDWIVNRVVTSARGTNERVREYEPRSSFWLGRLEPEVAVINSTFGDRAERMAPCAIGFRVRPATDPPWHLNVSVSGCAWRRVRLDSRDEWHKTEVVVGRSTLNISTDVETSYHIHATEFEANLRAALSADVLRMGIRVDVERGRDGNVEFALTCVNESPEDSSLLKDTGIYQVQLRLEPFPTRPFLLESLPESFRYDRRIPAYGINCAAIACGDGAIETRDVMQVDRRRPAYWSSTDEAPDFSFATLSMDPLPQLRQLVSTHRRWGDQEWSSAELDRRMLEETWSVAMRAQATEAASEFQREAIRLAAGLHLLETNEPLRRAFTLMNESMQHSSRGRYLGWRPFQVGFLLANIASVLGDDSDTDVADILWFATGGGKTETYLGLLIAGAFHGRLTGKLSGISAWSRFPLRLLSLQQTQRFADAIAGAEAVRRRHSISGDSFSLGFFVGDSSTPNRISNDPPVGAPDPLDETMPARFQVLLRCPFCSGEVSMAFNRRLWRLEHRCLNNECEWPEEALPLYIVDEEIYRFLPTIVVGTLDKVASISMQAAMRGFVAAPNGICSENGHGYTYAPRTDRPNGCLVPGCRGSQQTLPIANDRFMPTFRLQDELHLLRDSLGAIDSHYEALLDHLSQGNQEPKIVASSATLTGFERQSRTLYSRTGRVFPAPGPRIQESFWSNETTALLRRYVAISPRGATLEFAADRILTECQSAIRQLHSDPDGVCSELGIDVSCAEEAVSLYGTNVVYGNTIRDLDAAVRSLETQIPVAPLHTATMTGHTPFEDVRAILNRLQRPEAAFGDRLHIVAASSMMSHGVDIDRLNMMVMLGQPLTTAEFIQSTARIGRTYPGLVLVLHKMSLERDASIFRSFKAFVEQGDRFVEAIPITRRSRRVLERTLPGLIMARIRHIHEPASGIALTTVSRLRGYFAGQGITAATELDAVARMLEWEFPRDERLRAEAERRLNEFFRRLNDPSTSERFPDRLFTTPVMRSLRDVEEQAPIHD